MRHQIAVEICDPASSTEPAARTSHRRPHSSSRSARSLDSTPSGLRTATVSPVPVASTSRTMKPNSGEASNADPTDSGFPAGFTAVTCAAPSGVSVSNECRAGNGPRCAASCRANSGAENAAPDATNPAARQSPAPLTSA